MREAVPVNEHAVSFVPLNEMNTELITSIDAAAYPPYMQMWCKEGVLHEDYMKRDITRFSFLLHGSAWLGYCIALLVDAKDDEPDSNYQTLYVANMAVLPGTQKRGYGTVMAMEVLRRATDAGIKNIAFHARETTTYQILQNSEVVDQVLGAYGYELNMPGEDLKYPEDAVDPIERAYLVHLKKSKNGQ